MNNLKIKLIVSLLAIILCIRAGFAQETLTRDQAVQIALKNNASLKSAAFNVDAQRSLKGTAFDLPKTNVSLLYGQYNGYPKNDNNVTITQTIPFTALGSQGRLNRANVTSSELQLNVTQNELIYQVQQAYLELAYAKARQKLLEQQDSIFQEFLKAARARYKSGETNLLEQATAETQASEVKNQLHQNAAKIAAQQAQLKALLNSNSLPDAADNLIEYPSASVDSFLLTTNPSLQYMNQQIEVAKSQKKLEAGKFAPDITLGVFSQTLIDVLNSEGQAATRSNRFTGFQIGLAIPLWFGTHLSRVRAAEYNRKAAESNYAYYQQTLNAQQQQALKQYEAAQNSLTYYKSSALVNAELIIKQSQTAFRGGDITYTEYLIALRNAVSVKENYLSTLRDYNQAVLYIEYLSGNK